MNITNDYNSLRRERVIVRQQHRKDSSCHRRVGVSELVRWRVDWLPKEQMLRLCTNYYTSVFVLMVYCAVQCPCQFQMQLALLRKHAVKRFT